jgi:hypothetical protein
MAKKIPLPPILQKAKFSDSVFIFLNYKTDKDGAMKVEEKCRYDITMQLREFIIINRGLIEHVLANDSLENIYEDRNKSRQTLNIEDSAA